MWVFQKAPENAIAPANLQTLCSLAFKKCEGMQAHTKGTAWAPGRSALFRLRRARQFHLAVDMAESLIAVPASPASPSALFEGERGPLGVTRFRGARNPWMKRALQGTLGCNTSTGTYLENNLYISSDAATCSIVESQVGMRNLFCNNNMYAAIYNTRLVMFLQDIQGASKPLDLKMTTKRYKMHVETPSGICGSKHSAVAGKVGGPMRPFQQIMMITTVFIVQKQYIKLYISWI